MQLRIGFLSRESLIAYEGKKYSVPPKYIGKYVDIEDEGTGFNITFNGHFIAKCSRISWSQAQAGDLAFLSDLSHVGIIAGKDTSGS